MCGFKFGLPAVRLKFDPSPLFFLKHIPPIDMSRLGIGTDSIRYQAKDNR